MSKDDFPIFKDQPDLLYLDSAATSLKPQVVVDVLTDYYQNYSANIHRGIYSLSEKTTKEYEASRDKIAQFIGAQPDEIIFTSGTTAGLNMVADSYRNVLGVGDEIVVSISEHHANMLPWQELANTTSAILKVTDDFSSAITAQTKILALSHVSNVLGSIRDLKAIASSARTISPDIHIVVDGAQAVPHLQVGVEDLDIDYYAFSGHKIYGPTGVGALWFKRDRLDTLKPLVVGGGAVGKVTASDFELLPAPQGFEAGTPPIAEAIAMGAAVEFLSSHTADKNLASKLFEAIDALPFTQTLGNNQSPRIPLVAFNINGIHAHDVAQFLAEQNLCVRAGHHCTMPLHTSLGLQASARASLGLYNDEKDITTLVEALIKCHKELGGTNV